MENTLPGRQADGASDRRWVVIRPDGGFSSLGRERNPSNEEIASSEAALVAHAIGGWLAIAEHSFYRESFPACVEVRRLGEPEGTFADAVEAVRRSVGASG